MGLSKKQKQMKKEREELLAEWNDIYGFNTTYGWTEMSIQDREGEHITVGMNVYSFKEDEEVDILITMSVESACWFVEEFLVEHQHLYLNHIANRVSNE